MLALCQKETIRLQHVGCFFRRNVSGKALPVGSGGEIVPPGAFVVCLLWCALLPPLQH